MKGRTVEEKSVVTMLPARLSAAVSKTLSFCSGCLCEVRLRSDGPLTVRVNEREIFTGVRCTAEEVAYTVRSLSGNSLYSHAETIKEGYICADGGIRAGVCGRAVTRGGVIDAVTDISSVNVRIPHRIPGAADRIVKYIGDGTTCSGMLIYSRPGVGKTTVLKELIRKLACGDHAHRVAVVDTRFELYTGIQDELMLADHLCGYPRGKGIEIAVRTMSPEFVVCDEISTADDARAVEEASSSGVYVIATCHAASFAEVKSSPVIRPLIDKKVFDRCVGLLRRREGGYDIEVNGEHVTQRGAGEQ